MECLNRFLSTYIILSQNEAGRRVEQCHGELLLDFEGGKIFSVTQHQNNPNLNFLTIEGKKVELYHKGKIKPYRFMTDMTKKLADT